MRQNITNKDLMERLNDLEKKNTLQSAVFLSYSLAIALLMGYYSTRIFMFIVLGVACYIVGFMLPYIKKIKRRLTSLITKK